MIAPAAVTTLAALPSPTRNAFEVGPVPIRFYALAIIAGAVLAVWIGERRWVARGGEPGLPADIAVWAVPAGLVGARLYHVITDPELYFGSGRHPIDAVKIWDGGLGIWGAVAFGVLGGWIGLRRRGIRLAPFADAVAPGIAVAQGTGRLGNWFNNELYGRSTDLPWGLTVHRMDDSTHRAVSTLPGHYQPTFLYELLWDFGTAGLVVWADRRFGLGRGRAFALYVMSYTAGRGWIEYLRSDFAHHLFGLRLNDWVSIVVFIAALAYFLLRRGPREECLTSGDADGDLGSGAAIGGDAGGRSDADVAATTGETEPGHSAKAEHADTATEHSGRADEAGH